MDTHHTTEPLDFSHETIQNVISGRIIRGLVPMLVEALAYGRALESGERFTPSSEGMRCLLETIDAIWRTERQVPLPFDDTPAHELPPVFGDDDPPLLHDELPAWLLNLPPVAHGIAPLPPLGGETRSTLGRHIR